MPGALSHQGGGQGEVGGEDSPLAVVVRSEDYCSDCAADGAQLYTPAPPLPVEAQGEKARTPSLLLLLLLLTCMPPLPAFFFFPTLMVYSFSFF